MNRDELAQWVIDHRYPKSEQNKVSDAEMYQFIIDHSTSPIQLPGRVQCEQESHQALLDHIYDPDPIGNFIKIWMECYDYLAQHREQPEQLPDGHDYHDWMGISQSEPEQSAMVICPICKGDGKETCTNPDHGFINMVGGETQRLGCPCCGHDPNHKIKNGGKCDECKGTGRVTNNKYEQLCDTYGIDEPVNEGWIELKSILEKWKITPDWNTGGWSIRFDFLKQIKDCIDFDNDPISEESIEAVLLAIIQIATYPSPPKPE